MSSWALDTSMRSDWVLQNEVCQVVRQHGLKGLLSCLLVFDPQLSFTLKLMNLQVQMSSRLSGSILSDVSFWLSS